MNLPMENFAVRGAGVPHVLLSYRVNRIVREHFEVL